MSTRPRSRVALTFLVMAAAAACDASPAPRVTEPGSVVLARQGNADMDSRARLVWDDVVDADGDAATPGTVPAGIHGDGYTRYSVMVGTPATPLNEYQGQVCGVHAKIFNTATASNSHDLVFDPDFDAPGKSCNGVTRMLRAHLGYQAGGAPGTFTAVGPFFNVRQIYDIAPDSSVQKSLRFGYVNQPGCETLAFDPGIDASASPVRVTRLADVVAGAGTARQWRVVSVAPHMAACLVQKKGAMVANGVQKYLPFAVTVTEVPYPYEITP